tara:strand:+ start:138 stop:1358 length:1221 start_codon:yes stop_codon:yes gene_type:complete
MHEILLSKFPEATQKDLDTFSKNVRQVESSGGTNLVNPDSSARGDFQFLTKGDGNSFQTALNRLSNTYASAGHKEPDWVDRARRSNNPMDLPYEQQEELMLANIYQQKGSDALLSKAFTGDRDASLEAYYKYHHTAPDAATIAAAESAFTTDSRPQVAEVPMEDRQYNLETVSAGVPSLPSITTTALTEADNMSTEKEPTGFGREWLASLLGVDPDMSVMDYFNGDLKAPKVSTTDVAKLAGNKPAVQLQQTASQVVPLQGTMPYINQGTVDRGLLESLNPAMSIQEAAYNDANQSVIQPTNIPHASEFGQAYVVPNTGPTAEELSAGAGSYVVPIGREPAGVAVEQQQGILEDQFGKPVRSGNKNVIGLPTQNPAYQAPAGGKGANATPQSAIDQLTGIKGFGGK